MQSPTQRTLARLRVLGYTAGVVEYWNPHVRKRRDLFGFLDIVAIKEGEPALGVQATSNANVMARVKKIQEEPRAKVWASAHQIQVWGWRKLKKPVPGDRRTWRERIVILDQNLEVIRDIR